MKNLNLMLKRCNSRRQCSDATIKECKPSGFWGAVIALLVVGCLTLTAQAQTTFKPFQIRAEWPAGVSGTLLLTNNNLRIATNGASVVDGMGTNWVIPSVSVSVGATPPGVTATVTDSSGNPVTTIPVNLNTGNTAMNTNLYVQLSFDGTQTSGTAAIGISFTGALTNGYFPLVVEIAKIWNGSDNALLNGAGNWSDTTKWLGGSPGPNDNVVFTDQGTQTNTLYGDGTITNLLVNSVVDSSTVISSLRFSQTNGLGSPLTNCHNLFINPGVTLAIKGNDGFKTLRDYTFWTPKMNVSISGTNGTLIQTNENSNFSLLTDGATSANAFTVLDMSRLGNLYLDVNQLQIGDCFAYPNYLYLATNLYNSGSTLGSSRPNKMNCSWLMAQTNYVKAVYVDPYNYTNADSRNYALMIGRNDITGGSSGSDYAVNMGISNGFYLDSICVAGYASLGSVVQFQNTNSSALFRNTNGGRMTIFATADAAGTTFGSTSGANTKCGPVNFTKGTIDMLVDRFYLSMDRGNRVDSGNGDSQTAFYFSSGVIDANTAILGYQSQPVETNQSYCYATMTVSNTGLFRVNGTLALGYTAAPQGAPVNPQLGYGQLTIGPGGTVTASNIAVGGTSKASTQNKISMIGNASLIVSNGIADSTPNGALGTFAMSGGNNSLTLFIDGSQPSIPIVYVTNLTASGTGNKIVIGGIKNVTYPANIPLITGMGGATISAASFDAGVVMPAGLGLHGTLVDSSAVGTSSNTIILQVINRTPNHLVWRAPADSTGTATWDYTTKNWLDQNTGLMTNYDNPDIVAFDDTPGYATNVVLSGGVSLTPTAVNMTNNSLYYTFQDGGTQIIGGPSLNKYGTGTVEVDGNTTFSVQVNQGTLTGSSPGVIGNVNIAAGAVMNYAGTIGGSVSCAGTGTSSSSIVGTLTVLNGGVMTNSGTAGSAISVQSGGLLYNAATGTLPNIGVGSSGAPQVASGGTFVNNGSIGQILGDNVLYVSGTFEDLGGTSDSLTLQSVTVGAGGTFIPGGDGIGTTTINSDGTGTFPGAALLVQGSTNVFKINVAGPANTVLSVNNLSFGGSSSVRTENGCTLQISNASTTPFSAGQSFHLFDNVSSPGTVPYNTGSSTNTYPVITPPTPGSGLSWDLSQLWVTGNIGIVGPGSGPVLTNSIAVTGTNIVGQFSWDSSKLGYRLETLVTSPDIGLAATNWTGVAGSWTNTSVTITNVVGTNCVFYRLSFP